MQHGPDDGKKWRLDGVALDGRLLRADGRHRCPNRVRLLDYPLAANCPRSSIPLTDE